MLKLFRKRQLSKEKIQKIEERVRLEELVRKIELFSGTLEEFERMKGYECEVIDNGQQNKTMIICLDYPYNEFMLESCKELKRLGVEALIRYESKKGSQWSICNDIIELRYPWDGKGIPIKKKYE